MDTIPHRDLRNRSSEILARVQAGGSFVVTNHGDPVAILSPVGASAVDRLERAGQLRAARVTDVDLTALSRVTGDSREILDDLRGDR